jgi:hypothetical protein
MSSRPLSLSDEQMRAVMTACQALQRVDRDPFLRALASRLHGETIGDGSIHRAIKELLKPGNGFFRPPQITQPNHMSAAKLKRERADAE